MDIINLKMIFSKEARMHRIDNVVYIINDDEIYPYYISNGAPSDVIGFLKEDGIEYMFNSNIDEKELISLSTREYDWKFDGSDLNTTFSEEFAHVGKLIGYNHLIKFNNPNPFNSPRLIRSIMKNYGFFDCLYTNYEMILLKNEQDYLKVKTLLTLDGIEHE